MKGILSKFIVSGLTLLAVSQTASASSSSGDGSGFYIVPKAVVVLGDTIMHHGHKLNGETGVGAGIDLGYSFTPNYALELSATHAEADVVEDDHIKDTAEYTTYGFNFAYTRILVGHFAILAKLGYAWEYEKMDKLHIKETLDGVTYALGFEYGVAENMELVFEVEGANVTSSRGESLLFGLKYKF
ncbi:MAG: outer membrane beta-barrel protein [Sulfurimonas sp.]|uniref:outer membrane beta-barrel protein n=1 Tax=Sulfurimonas sp. TaxID=2022749 RepID=UPI0028CCE9C9|nr:outer membrane beta-barrel protein [Sulfurimonas sp.]MDT8339766.1 outer membrane beta-barrel protein [Sulfurimonas sp.]